MACSRVIALSTLAVASFLTSPSHATYQYSVAFWRELGARETIESPDPGQRTNKIYFHVWHDDGWPTGHLKISAFDSRTNFQVGVIDESGYGEVSLQTTNRYTFALTPAFFGSKGTPLFVTDRLPTPGGYSWEIAFLGHFSWNDVLFNTNLVGAFSSAGNNACVDLHTPFTRSLAYGGSTNYCREPTTLGIVASSHGQTFIATGNRIMAAKVHFTSGSTQHVSFTAQILEGGPGGTPIGPPAVSALIPDGDYLRSFVTWRKHDVQVVPGQTYYLKITSTADFAVWREPDFYPDGIYYAGDQPQPGHDLEALIVCGNYTPREGTGTISGVVRDRNGNPLPRILLSTTHGYPGSYEAPFYDTTDENGQYRILDVAPYTYGVTAGGIGYTATTKTGIVVTALSNTVVNLVLQHHETNSGFIVGRITDAQSAPLPDAHVVAQPGPHVAFTRPDGTFELNYLPPANYTLAFSKIGYVSEVFHDVPIRIAQTNGFDLSLRPELLQNGNFERPLCTNDGVGTNWTRYITSGDGASRFLDQQYHLSGNYAQGLLSFNPHFDVGFHQRVPVLAGSNYQFSVWSIRTDDLRDAASIVETWVGIDPTGNTNPLSSTIIWSVPEARWDRWIRQTVEATAVSNTIALFLRSRGSSTNAGMRAAFDDAALDGAPASPLNLTASAAFKQVSLSWEPLAWADSYVVRRSTTAAGSFDVVTSSLTDATFVDTAVRNGQRYYYAVAGRRDNQTGVFSRPIEVTPVAHDIFVPVFARWRYLDDGSDQGNVWRGVNFDDNVWSEGTAPLGLEWDECISTPVIQGGSTTRFVTTYFRNVFIASPGPYADLRLRLRVDDGAIVYLNGTEVVRNNMPTNAVTYRTLARTNVFTVEAFRYHEARLPAALLREGTNVVAAEVHTYRTNAFSMSFALELAGMVPSVDVRLAGSSLVVSWPASLGSLQLQGASQLGAADQWVTVNAQFVTNRNVIEVELPRTANQQFFRLRRP